MAEDPQRGIGISWLWMESPQHPFYQPALVHDEQYELAYAGKNDLTLKQVDDALLSSMLEIARKRNSSKLKAQAYLFWSLAHLYGLVKWKGRR